MVKTIYWYECWFKKSRINYFEKGFFKLINNFFFLVTTEKRKNYLVLEWNYHTTKFFTKNLLAMKIRKTQENKAAYLGLSMLDLCRIVMDEFWYDYVKPKCDKKAKICCIDRESFKTFDFKRKPKRP